MKPKILFILHLPPPIHGAAMMGKYLRESELLERDFECRFLNLSISENLSAIGRFRWKKLLVYIQLLLRVLWQGLRFRPRVVYLTPSACGAGFYKDVLVVLLAKCIASQVVLHFHNKGVARQQSAWQRALYRLFFKGTKVILLANALYEDVQAYVKRSEVYICPNGIPPLEMPLSVPKRSGRRVLFLSNLYRSKGVYVLLDACQLLKQRGVEFCCDIVGGETEEIKQVQLQNEIEQRDLQAHVLYCGSKYGREKSECLARADILVFPSSNDVFPITLLEAMQMGLPCIATQEGGIPEVIDEGKSGFLVERENAGQLADKLQYLMEHPEVAQGMGAYGKERFAQRFTQTHFEERIVQILRETTKDLS